MLPRIDGNFDCATLEMACPKFLSGFYLMPHEINKLKYRVNAEIAKTFLQVVLCLILQPFLLDK